MVRRDRAFRLFLYVQLLGGVTRMVMPFYVVKARVVGGLPELEVGTLLAAQAIGGIALNPLWGWWADRRGTLSLLKAARAHQRREPAAGDHPAGAEALPRGHSRRVRPRALVAPSRLLPFLAGVLLEVVSFHVLFALAAAAALLGRLAVLRWLEAGETVRR